MLWVLQPNLYSERGYDRLIEALDRLGCDRTFVKPIPFTGRLAPADFDARTASEIEDIPEPEIDTSRSIITMGSYTLAKIAHARQWHPGAFLDNTSYDQWAAGFGHERVLNPHAWTGPLRDAVLTEDSFVRPLSDSKSFVGKVYDPVEFHDWQAQILPLGEGSYVTGDTEVLVAAPQVIWNETRCFVIDGRIVSASFYRMGRDVRYEEVLDGPQLEFARECIQYWTPSRAFVVDIAGTPDGFRVVEVNCINAAGFYACDLQRIVAAFEEAFPE